jgi:hypothetical protein
MVLDNPMEDIGSQIVHDDNISEDALLDGFECEHDSVPESDDFMSLTMIHDSISYPQFNHFYRFVFPITPGSNYGFFVMADGQKKFIKLPNSENRMQSQRVNSFASGDHVYMWDNDLNGLHQGNVHSVLGSNSVTLELNDTQSHTMSMEAARLHLFRCPSFITPSPETKVTASKLMELIMVLKSMGPCQDDEFVYITRSVQNSTLVGWKERLRKQLLLITELAATMSEYEKASVMKVKREENNKSFHPNVLLLYRR